MIKTISKSQGNSREVDREIGMMGRRQVTPGWAYDLCIRWRCWDGDELCPGGK